MEVQPGSALARGFLGLFQGLVFLAVGGARKEVSGRKRMAGRDPARPEVGGGAELPAARGRVLASEVVQHRAVVIDPAPARNLSRTVFVATEIVRLSVIPTPDSGRQSGIVLVQLIKVYDGGPALEVLGDVRRADRRSGAPYAADGGGVLPDAAYSPEAGVHHGVPAGVAAASSLIPDHHLLARGEDVSFGQVRWNVTAPPAAVDQMPETAVHMPVGFAVLAVHMILDMEDQDLVVACGAIQPGQDFIQSFGEIAVTGTAAQVNRSPVTQEQSVREG